MAPPHANKACTVIAMLPLHASAERASQLQFRQQWLVDNILAECGHWSGRLGY